MDGQGALFRDVGMADVARAQTLSAPTFAKVSPSPSSVPSLWAAMPSKVQANVPSLLTPSTTATSPALRERGDVVEMAECYGGRHSDYDAPSCGGLGDLSSVPMRPLLLAGGDHVVSVRGELQAACMAVDSYLADAGVVALSVQDGHMSFYGGADASAVFTVEVYEDTLHVDEAGMVWPTYIFVLEALHTSEQACVSRLACALQQAVPAV